MVSLGHNELTQQHLDRPYGMIELYQHWLLWWPVGWHDANHQMCLKIILSKIRFGTNELIIPANKNIIKTPHGCWNGTFSTQINNNTEKLLKQCHYHVVTSVTHWSPIHGINHAVNRGLRESAIRNRPHIKMNKPLGVHLIWRWNKPLRVCLKMIIGFCHSGQDSYESDIPYLFNSTS